MRLLPLLLSLPLLGACAANSRRAPTALASAVAEPQVVWTRPVEVTYTLGDRIEGEATMTRLLGINVGGAKPDTQALASVLAVLPTRNSAAHDALLSHAAFNAARQANVDGIYITQVESDSTGFLFLMRTTTTRVTGRALSLQTLGVVSQERADAARGGQ